jgi:hypothetical protein
VNKPYTGTIPTVGIGATAGVGSDCYPYTVHDVSPDRKKIWVSSDNHSENLKTWPDQEYTYSNEDEYAPEMWLLCTLRKDGYYHFGKSMQGARIHIGHRRYYQDPSF